MIDNDLASLGWRFDALVDEASFAKLARSREGSPQDFKVAQDDDQRIFPGYFTPIIYQGKDDRVIQPMRYSAYPPSYLSPAQSKGLSTFNARRDSLSKRFWSEAVACNHGLMVIRSFYEWVRVEDLLKAGSVTLDDVISHFEGEKAERRQRWLDKGKDLARLKPTKTELMDPVDRNIIITFEAPAMASMVVPVIFSFDEKTGYGGCALITDEPTPEIRSAGHDRMPILLPEDKINRWLSAMGEDLDTIDEILACGVRPSFVHKISPIAAYWR